ncbi:MAG TPA: class I SAM-dependent methyltransferase [Sphingomicrobium sp.]|nr:class I SAM-dependent methyltransferase [Sphingomicrobium sp.]
MGGNIDPKTVEGFGEEWDAYDQSGLRPDEHQQLFDSYFAIFPFTELPTDAEGFDLGCGSGRWAMLVAPRVGRLHCIDPAPKALEVARRRLADCRNVEFHLASVDRIPLRDGSQDFGYSLGVLHHVPDAEAALASCVRKLKPGAPFLLYLYYSLDNRPLPYRLLWRASDLLRKAISRMPFRARKSITTLLAAGVYYPLARTARGLEGAGASVRHFPLSAYRDASFYTMRTDALDRFGTRLEKRFSRAQIEDMMRSSGLENITFSEQVPHWVACGRKR